MTIKATHKVTLNPNFNADAMKAAQEKLNTLKLDFRNAVVQALTEQGNTFSGNLRATFKERGLSDEIMDGITAEVMSQPR